MALFALTFRILLTLSIAVGPMVCRCSAGAAADVHDGCSCHGQTVPMPSHAPSPTPDKEHAPGVCPGCAGSVFSIDLMPGTPLMGSGPTLAHNFFWTDPLRWAGRMNPAPPRFAWHAKPQATFGGDSLRALLTLLTI